MPTSDPRDRRTAPRFTLRVPVVFEGPGLKGQGRVENISEVGVRIEGSDVRPIEGARITIFIALRAGATPVRLVGEVVRTTRSGGFCLSFVDMDPRVQRVLNTMLPRLTQGVSHLDDDAEVELSGELQLALGQDLHGQIARLAEAEGLNPTEWARTQLSQSAHRTQRHRDHRNRPGHDSNTCADCIRERRGSRRD